MKKFLLSMLGVLIALPGIARDFSYEYEGQTLTYTVLDEDAKTCKTKEGTADYYGNPGNKVTGDLKIPAIAKDGDVEYSVTTIGYRAFYNCTGLTSVIIPNSVTSIGSQAFYKCSGLIKSAYPDNLSKPFDNGTAVSYPAEGAVIEDGVVYGTDKSAIYFASPSLEGEFVIPNSVTTIGKDAFYNCSGLTSVEIPNSVNSIGEYAFYGCSDLTSVIIPNSVTSIGNRAFYKCSRLIKSAYPDNLSNPFSNGVALWYPAQGTVIEDGVVYGPDKSAIYFASLSIEGKFVIPNSVTYIHIWAFQYCSGLTSVEIPNSVTSIGEYAFNGCSGLTSVEIPNSVTSIGESAFKSCSGLKDFTVQDGETELSFGSDALYSAPIENLYMGRNWSYAKNEAISTVIKEAISTAIKNVTISDKVTALPDYAFTGCTGLTSVEIPNSVTSIGYLAFYNCSGLTSVIIPNSVTSIGIGAFNGCSGLTSVFIPNSVTSIGRSTFNGCSGLTSVEIPNSVPSIDEYTFNGCTGLTSVEIPNSVTYIGESAFDGCTGLTSVIIPNSVTYIGYRAFYNCSGLIKSAYPDNLSNPFSNGEAFSYPRKGAIIEDGIVYGPDKSAIYFASPSLEGEFVIPNSVTSIGSSAFEKCTSLTSVKATNVIPPAMSDNSFQGLYSKVTLSLPDNSINNYLATNWSLFENLRAGDSDETLATYVNSPLKYRLIPAKTPEDKNLAIVIPGNYSSLTEITIPERFTVSENGNNTRYYVDAIGYKAFKGCSKLKTVTFNSRNASTVIGEYAFAGTSIPSIVIPETVETIGNHAFDGCSELDNITIPSSVKAIGDYAFNETTKLKNVTLNEGLETIGAKAFRHNHIIVSSSIYIPSTVKFIGLDAFYGFSYEKVEISDLKAWLDIEFANSYANPINGSWSNLYLNGEVVTEISIPEGVTEIKPYAFCGATALKSVTFNEGLQRIGYQAFYYARNLWAITIPGSVVSIGEMAFASLASSPRVSFLNGSTPVKTASNSFQAPESLSCDRPMENLNLDVWRLKTLVIGNSVTEIPASKFKGATSLTSLTLGSGLTAIGENAFNGCTELTEVIVPPSVETIGASAFAGNTKLTSIIMGHSVKNIGEKAFDLCLAQTVSITAQTPPDAPDNTFSNYTGNLYVQGEDAADAYYDADYCWHQFEGYVMIEPTELKVEGDKTLNGKPGDTFQLTAKLYPENVTLPQIFWRSTNPEIATVDNNGLVTLHVEVGAEMGVAPRQAARSAGCEIIAESLYADGPVAKVSIDGVASGISDVTIDGAQDGEIDYNAPYEVYSLQGTMVGHSLKDLAPGIYIVRQGRNVKKIAVR